MNIQTITHDPEIAAVHYARYRDLVKKHRAERKAQLEAARLKASRGYRQARTELAALLEVPEDDLTKAHLKRARCSSSRGFREAREKIAKIGIEDEQLMQNYKALKEGKALIHVPQTILEAGLNDEQHLPKLAICRADAKRGYVHFGVNTTWFSHDGGIQYDWSKKKVRKASYTIRISTHTNDWSEYWRRRQEWCPGGVAMVPSVPAHLRPADLSKYFILWEAEWTAQAPTDPILLSRVTEHTFAVVAQWDLTPLERLVLADNRS